jgi:ABC-type Fe3+/spermidine/putrescine transport system ATPase subunit
MSSIQLQNITKRFDSATAVNSVSLNIEAGEFLTLLGPSGCGKSTTLRILAGLTRPDSGRVLMSGKDVTALSPSERRVGMVFQSLALFPHMTAADNVGFGLKMRGVNGAGRKERIARALELVHLSHLADRYPRQMSGGQQQRVALARALVIEPSILILDEPFAALDRKLRESMQTELHRITRELKITTLFVTHDQEEALMLSDWIAVMKGGMVEQLGRAGEIFERPRTQFVADFMGISNFIKAKVISVSDEGVRLNAQGLVFSGPLGDGLEKGKIIDLALRPDRIELDVAPDATCYSLEPAKVTQAIYHGLASSYTIALASGQMLSVRDVNAATGTSRFAVGADVWPKVKTSAVCYLAS